MILSGDYEFLSPFWDDISQSAKVNNYFTLYLYFGTQASLTVSKRPWN